MTAPQTPEEKKPLKHKKLIIVLAVILAFILTFVATFFIMVKVGEARLRKNLVTDETVETSEDLSQDEAVYYNGKAHYYNKDLVNILLIGVDREAESKTDQGQADALYLVSVDTERNNVNIMSISRNTLTDVDILDSQGDVYGTEREQICLAYSYGKTDVSSSENCTKAVSNLLYGVPISGYYTIHMSSIGDIVDAVGGVTVTIPKDANEGCFYDRLGQTVTLKGEEAVTYLRMRGDSNAPRLERHKAFIGSFVNSAKTAVKNDLTLPFKMANKLSKEAVTNIDTSSVVYLATKALNWKLNFLSIEGKSGFDGQYETFEADEEKLQELVLNSFYNVK